MNPQTWIDVRTVFGTDFKREWYDGDVEDDLNRTRQLALKICQTIQGATCQLNILDDWTLYIDVFIGGAPVVSIWPIDDDGTPLYFAWTADKRQDVTTTTDEMLDWICRWQH